MWLHPPPRRVPLSITVINALGSQIAWGILGFTSIFFWTFVMNADLSAITFRGPMRYASATVTKVIDTRARENKQNVYANHYEYSAAGRTLTGVSYSTSTSASVGDRVAVEYKEDDPVQSRIDGMRRGMFGPAVLFVLLFPTIGLAWLFYSIRSGMRRRHLLENGRLTTGKLIDRKATNVQVNRQTVWELTFEYSTPEGKKTAKVRTHQTASLEDEKEEPLLYDPRDSSRVYMLDELPSRPAIDLMGELQGRPRAAALSLILPTIVTLANLLAAIF